MTPHPAAPDTPSAEALPEVARALDERHRRPVAPLDEEERRELAAAQSDLGGAAWGADACVAASIARLGEEGALAVVAGQQTGLLGGPLYAFAKAAACVATARDLEARLGRPVVPLFWLASDDHDFEEIRGATWLGVDGAPVTFRLADGAGDPRVAAFARRFGAGDADALAAEIERTTHATEFRADVVAWLRTTCAEGMTLPQHFGRVLARLVAGSGLVFVAPHLGFLRRRGADVMRRELADPGATTRLVLEAGDAIEGEGGRAALHRVAGAVNAFHLLDGVRRRMRVAGSPAEGGAAAAGAIIEVEEEPDVWRGRGVGAWLDELAAHPERFSPNVVTRPLVQDAALPTIAMIAGPGERAYFRQLGAVYAHVGVARPWVAARPELLLVEPRIRRALERLRTTPRRLLPLLRGEGGAIDSLLGALDDGPRLLFEMDRLTVALGGRVEALGHALPPAFTRARGGLDKMRDQVEKSVQRLREAIHRDAEQAQQELAGHLDKVRAALLPGGAPQERVFNLVVPFLVNYGVEAGHRLARAMPAAADAPALWMAPLPLGEAACLERLDAPPDEAVLWQGADI